MHVKSAVSITRAVTLAALPAALIIVAGRADAQSLRGSTASVTRMHRYATSHSLAFHRNASAVSAAAAAGRLVRLRSSSDLGIASISHPYVRPTTDLFVRRLASQYREACGQRLVVTGATRPLSVRLANGSPRSVHPTGIAVDLRRPTGKCLTWLRKTLLSLEKQGVIEATEERRPPHFHVVVFETKYRGYLAARGVATGRSAAAGGGQ